jgi:thiol-disulfide isomerase/thioredoxin
MKFRLLLGAALLAATTAPVASGESKAPETAAPATTDAEALEPSDHYVHRWIPMPSFAATEILTQEPTQISVRKGRAQVILFLASWCEPCQQLMGDYIRVQKKYSRLNTDFIYVFAHDTKDDAEGFMKEYGMKQGYLANHDVLKAYHNPELPTIYVADRHGWLATRMVKATNKEVEALVDFLKPITAY